MRFKIKYSKVGDKKIIEKFAWYPIWIGTEVRWLENVKIEKEYSKDAKVNATCGRMKDGWVVNEFIDN